MLSREWRCSWSSADRRCSNYTYQGASYIRGFTVYALCISPEGCIVTEGFMQKWCDSQALIQDKHDDVIKWKHFPRYWPFVRGIHRSPVNAPHKGQWRGALIFTLICARINGWVNNREAGDLRRYRAHYDVIVMIYHLTSTGNPIMEVRWW